MLSLDQNLVKWGDNMQQCGGLCVQTLSPLYKQIHPLSASICLIDHYSKNTQCFDYHAWLLIPLQRQAVLCIEMLRNRWWKTETVSRNWGNKTKSLKQTLNSSSASLLKNRHKEVQLISFLLHQHAIIHSQRISLSFWPASWERKWKWGCFWSSTVCVCLLVISGESSNICSFSIWHKTYSQSLLAHIRCKFRAPSFWQHSLCRYAMASVISTWAKQIIVFVNSCHGDAPTRTDS